MCVLSVVEFVLSVSGLKALGLINYLIFICCIIGPKLFIILETTFKAILLSILYSLLVENRVIDLLGGIQQVGVLSMPLSPTPHRSGLLCYEIQKICLI